MQHRIRRLTLARCLFLVAAALVPASAAAQSKPVLEHDVYERWNTLAGETLSDDGAWVLYHRERYDSDGDLVVRQTAGEAMHVIARGTSGRFDAGSRYVVFTINAARDSVLQARRDGRRGDRAPRDTLGILDLRTGTVTRVPNLQSFRTPEEGGVWVAYHRVGAGDEAAADSTDVPTEEEVAMAREEELIPGAEPADSAADPRTKEAGSPLFIRMLETGDERRIDDVASYSIPDDGSTIAYVVSTKTGAGDGVYLHDVAGNTTTAVLTGAGEYRSLTFDEAGRQLAFISNRETWAQDSLAPYALYHWRPGVTEARRIAGTGTPGIPAGWEVSTNGSVSFAHSGGRIFFGTAPRVEPEPEDDRLPEERVGVDVWHWQDAEIMPMQLRRAAQERRRTYEAVAHLSNRRVVQLADEALQSVNVGERGDADIATASDGAPYGVESSWDSPNWSDVYLVDVNTGERTLIRERVQGGVSLSPDARFAVWYDYPTRAWHALDVRTRDVVDLTSSLPHPIHNVLHDQPSPAGSMGSAGWLEDDAAFLIYDRYDVWRVDPTGRTGAVSLTGGAGRAAGVEYRVVRLDTEDPWLPADEPLLLSAFNERTKEDGFARVPVRGGTPQQLVMDDYMFSNPDRADDADVLLFTRESFTEFPDLWVSDSDFDGMRRITAENPQQAEYNWGTAELVEWTSLDGVPLQGVLYKPENFDPSRQYPLIAYFYERMSDGLHLHYAPVPHRSRINFTYYASRGYLVFVPDIVYRDGYPGESAMNSIMPGVMKLLDRGYVDRDRLALQGHSWGGYQIAFMVTRTNLFRAGAAGAPVANMTSAYGGVRWESGMGRQFQYERTQSRLGGPLWDMPLRYLENSPLFWLDKVETPLLVMHNDNDGAVPWEQGIELYLGLRRLGKPVWLINYNGEPHWPTTTANKRDWNIRMQQFFDHYLMGAPAPRWLSEGIPATEKGRTLGYE